MKRFEDYKAEVILAYKKKKKEGTLPRNLQDHTPANLKKECIDEFLSRYTKNDSEIFKSLFGKASSKEEYFQKLKTSDPDIFRPLNTFLRRNTDSGTFNRNIELLAWLIDFEPRPYKPLDYRDIGKTESDLSTTTAVPIVIGNVPPKNDLASEDVIEPEIIIEPEIVIDEAEHIDVEKENQDTFITTSDGKQKVEKGILGIPRKFKKTILAFLATLLLVGCLYLYHNYLDPPQCMYWNNDHYQPIACDQKVFGATIIPIDTFSVAHFKKITNISTITRNDIGKVYYLKVYGTPEFYTTEGKKPIGNHKQLLPMSKWIYEKYVLAKQLSQ